jgi:hypothetical protein
MNEQWKSQQTWSLLCCVLPQNLSQVCTIVLVQFYGELRLREETQLRLLLVFIGLCTSIDGWRNSGSCSRYDAASQSFWRLGRGAWPEPPDRSSPSYQGTALPSCQIFWFLPRPLYFEHMHILLPAVLGDHQTLDFWSRDAMISAGLNVKL